MQITVDNGYTSIRQQLKYTNYKKISTDKYPVFNKTQLYMQYDKFLLRRL